MRLFLIDALSGKIRQPRVKEGKLQADRGEMAIARSILEDRINGKKNATEGKGRSARQAARYLKKWRASARWEIEFEDNMAFVKLVYDHFGVAARTWPRYYLARTQPHSGSPNDIS